MVIFLLVLFIFILFIALITFIFFKLLFTNGKHTYKMKASKTYIDSNNEGIAWLNKNKNIKDMYIDSFDKHKLHAYFIEGDKYQDQTILCVHGYKTESGLNDFGMSIKYLCSTGYNILIVDNRAHGKSEGKYIGFSILDSEDIASWCNNLVNILKQKKIILYGISMGGATVINAVANKDIPKEVVGLISDGSFNNAYEQIAHQIKRYYHLPSIPLIWFYELYIKIFAHYSFKQLKPIESIKKFKGYALFIHGGNDHLVPTKNVYNLYNNCLSSKDLLVVENASHSKSYLLDKDNYELKFNDLIEKVNNTK